MHHKPRWERAFSEMIRVLRPGGYFAEIPCRKRVQSRALKAGLRRFIRVCTGSLTRQRNRGMSILSPVFQVAVDAFGGFAAFRYGPHYQRLAAAQVAGGEYSR